jgi:hypothetical protein
VDAKAGLDQAAKDSLDILTAAGAVK